MFWLGVAWFMSGVCLGAVFMHGVIRGRDQGSELTLLELRSKLTRLCNEWREYANGWNQETIYHQTYSAFADELDNVLCGKSPIDRDELEGEPEGEVGL